MGSIERSNKKWSTLIQWAIITYNGTVSKPVLAAVEETNSMHQHDVDYNDVENNAYFHICFHNIWLYTNNELFSKFFFLSINTLFGI